MPSARILAGLHDTNILKQAASLSDPSGGKFTYPVEKRRIKENVAALRSAENHLDAFWAAVDQAMIGNTGDVSGTAVHDLLSQPRIFQRTPEWVEPTNPTQNKSGDLILTLLKPIPIFRGKQ